MLKVDEASLIKGQCVKYPKLPSQRYNLTSPGDRPKNEIVSTKCGVSAALMEKKRLLLCSGRFC